MALEQIFSRISEDAKIEAEGILRAASDEEYKILDSAKKEAVLLKDNIIATSRAEAESAFQKELVNKRLTSQKELLEIKKRQMDNCFQEALDTLYNLDDDLYRNLVKKMLTKINFNQKAEIIFSSRDKGRISQEYLHKLNLHLKLLFSNDIRAGFILQTKELIIDNSWENVLASLRPDLEPKVAQTLFTPLDSEHPSGV